MAGKNNKPRTIAERWQTPCDVTEHGSWSMALYGCTFRKNHEGDCNHGVVLKEGTQQWDRVHLW